ncbi:FAD-dependent oxidoreductase [Actinoplanes aureus]|uniref:FAD-dependent oxidoreductase n=1 Tax=Actinoplanes aureus TaxID=2792083 RepID=A0A931C9T0_9ACTN|nr:FAD-dependent oxidoreductase [Actinoplanes aureus]MBG0563153.1 FAD-dependent oxidoreductase [Actinoplanes aureus]
MTPTVIVVGGGYGGIAVAKALDDVADVTLVEPRETFVHNVAALRATVDPEWTDKIFIRYDGLLSRGRVVRDRAARVSATEVELASGVRLPADYVVLATGSSAPFPGKIDSLVRDDAVTRLHRTRDALLRSSKVLLLGAGAIGLEFAGEIKAAWPEKSVTLVEAGTDLLGGRFPGEFRAELRRQLDALGVHLLLGTSLRALPEPDAGSLRPFTVTTAEGDVLAADLWFPCFGAEVRTDYLDAGLAAARQPDGRLAVTSQLRLAGQETVFAVGDVTAVPELKQARAAGEHAEVVAGNIRALIGGEPVRHEYRPAPDAMLLPLGPAAGAGYAPEWGLVGAEATAQYKGTFFLDDYRELLGARVSA